MNRLSFGSLLCLLCLQALGLAPLHGSIVRVRLFVVVAARAAEEKQNLLSVRTAHAVSFLNWRAIVKRPIFSVRSIPHG